MGTPASEELSQKKPIQLTFWLQQVELRTKARFEQGGRLEHPPYREAQYGALRGRKEFCPFDDCQLTAVLLSLRTCPWDLPPPAAP
uniref:Uncharacterized protein n=1 Tax=Mustela putorius furo TaxID=9669 RepID=M3YHE4_MUSPF